MCWSNKKTLQTIGWLLIIFGIVLILLSLLGSTRTNYQCPSSGCPPYNLSDVPLYGPSLFLGLALVIIGIILVITARKMKTEQESDT